MSTTVRTIFSTSASYRGLPGFFAKCRNVPTVIEIEAMSKLPLRRNDVQIISGDSKSSVRRIVISLRQPGARTCRLLENFGPPFS